MLHRPSLVMLLLLGLAGCEESTPTTYLGASDYLPYLAQMKRVVLTLDAVTVHSVFEKQGARDGGHTRVTEMPRRYVFTNDSLYAVQWTDTGFSSKCNFIVREFELPKREFAYAANNSTLAGYYDNETRSLRDVRGSFKFTEYWSQTDWQFADGSLATTCVFSMESADEDSAVFVANASELPQTTILGYGAEETWYTTYIKRTKLDSVLWNSDSRLRLVFYRE